MEYLAGRGGQSSVVVVLLGLPFLIRVGSIRSGERGSSGHVRGGDSGKEDLGAPEKGVGRAQKQEMKKHQCEEFRKSFHVASSLPGDRGSA